MRTVTGWAVLFLLLLAGPAASADTHPADLALDEGNRLFEADEIEAALEAYARGWTGDGSRADGILAYNTGTCALHLGRLPEALLWYRRAEVAIPGDPWLRDNLAHTHHALGGDPAMEDLPSSSSSWSRPLAFAGVALAWTTFLLVVLARRPSRGLLALLALLACASFAAGIAGMLPGRFGPRAAVLLLPCGGLPAGSEVRVRALDGGGWRIVGQGDRLRCPAEGVGLVGP